MARPAVPWYWAARDGWYATIDGKRHLLAKGKKSRRAADDKFHKLMAARGTTPRAGGTITVLELFDRFLSWTGEHRRPLTYEFYDRHLSRFADHVGRGTPCGDVRAFHVTEWLADRKWGQSTRHGAITAAKRVFRWGKRQGYLETNHLDGLDRPGIARRESILSPQEEADVLAAAPGLLRDYLIVMHATGCRPSEVAQIEASQVSGGAIMMSSKTTERTGRNRVIYLTGTAVEVVGRLAAAHPSGPIFRNARGNPWTRHALAHAMGRLRRKLKGADWRACTAESFRHGWVTDAKLVLPNSVVAELAGHTSTAMVDRHYGHLSDRKTELAAAAGRVRGTSEHTPALSSDSAAPDPVAAPAPSPPPRTPPDRTP